MIADAKAADTYKHAEMGRSYDRITIVTIKEMLEEHKRLDIPMSLEVLKAAEKEVQGHQLALL
ncbi:MAG: hypothetical protein ACRDHZ_19650 [Ktedonobacteraceae bacterium]